MCGMNQRRAQTAKAASKPMPMAKPSRPVSGKGYRPDGAGDDHHQEMDTEHAAQQLRDRLDIKLHQQKGGRRQQEISHRKQQDDDGGEGNGIGQHATTPFLSRPGRAFLR